MLEISLLAHVATVRGARDVPFAEFAEALEGLTGGYECRAIVVPLEGRGEAPAPTGRELLSMERFPIPLIAALTGDVSGTASALALGCDIRVAADGITIGGIRMGTRRVLTLLGEAGSVAVMERGGRIDAASALALGLVFRTGADGVAEAREVALVIASRGPIATRTAKEAIWRGREMPLPAALRFETDLTILLQSTKDRAEGVRAFAEKRMPAFTGD